MSTHNFNIGNKKGDPLHTLFGIHQPMVLIRNGLFAETADIAQPS